MAKRRGERGSPCLTPLVHLKSFPAVPLRRTEEVAVDNSSSIHLNHFGGEAFSMKHLQNSGMFNQIKGLFKVQLQDNNLPSRVVTLVKKLKSPAKTVLNSSPFDETILVFMNNL
jgi:hypothetical protein